MMKPADMRDNNFEYREGAIGDPTTANMAGIKGDSKKAICFSLLR